MDAVKEPSSEQLDAYASNNSDQTFLVEDELNKAIRGILKDPTNALEWNS